MSEQSMNSHIYVFSFSSTFPAHPPPSLPSSIHDYSQVWESINANEVITNATKARAMCFHGVPCGQY